MIFFIVILVLVLCIDLEYWCLTDVVFLIGPDILTIETKYLGVLLMICQVKNVLKRKLHAGLDSCVVLPLAEWKK